MFEGDKCVRGLHMRTLIASRHSWQARCMRPWIASLSPNRLSDISQQQSLVIVGQYASFISYQEKSKSW